MTAWKPINENTPRDRRILVRRTDGISFCVVGVFNQVEQIHEFAAATFRGATLIVDDVVEWAEIPE